MREEVETLTNHNPRQCGNTALTKAAQEIHTVINDLNRVMLMGYLGADAKAPQSDNAPVCFSIATTDRWMVEGTKSTRTEWHNIVVFGNLRKYAAKLKKGDRVYIDGQLRSSSYDKTVGGETITVYNHEIAVSQIERVAAKNEADADSDN